MIQAIGRSFIRYSSDFVYVAGFFVEILRESFLFFRKRQAGFRILIFQILFSGVEALATISVIALAIGGIILVYGLELLPKLSQQKLIYSVMVIVITRQLGPILTAFIVIARSSTAIATELGNMVISHEIEAFVSVGVNPISYLAVPRFLGVTVSVILLTVYFNILGIGGSFFLTQFVNPIPFREYFSNILTALTGLDIAACLIKSVVFGAISSTIAIYYGFKVQRASTEIPQVAIKAVGRGFTLCIIADAVITVLLYL